MMPTTIHPNRMVRRVALACATGVMLCLIVAPAFAAKSSPAVYQAALQAASPGSRVSCVTDPYGNPACKIEGEDISIVDDCTNNIFFGGVTDDNGATLEDNFKSSSAKPVAHIGKRQLLCIQATMTRHGELIRALVKAVPTKTVKDCKGNDMCVGADTHVEWKRPVSGTACTLKADGHYVGDCPTGWVDGDKIEEYSMGLSPIDTGA